MCPPVRPTRSLDVGGTQRLDLEHRVGDVAAEPADRAEGQVGHLLPARFPVAHGEGVRHVLGEDAHRLDPLGDHAPVVRRLEVELGPEPVGKPAGARGREGGLPLGLRERRVDLPQVMLPPRSRPGLEVGQRAEGDVELDRAAGHRNRLDPRPPCRVGRVAQQPQRDPRVGVHDDDRSIDPLAGFELDPLARHDPGDRHVRSPPRRRPRGRRRRGGTRPCPSPP